MFQITQQGLFQQFWEKAPGQNWEKIIYLTSKLGEINDNEHYKGSKIYPQNQVILDCIMSSIPLKHRYLSIILIWVSVSHKKKWCLKRVKKKFGGKSDMVLGKKVTFLIGNGAEIRPLEMGRKGPGRPCLNF